MNVRAKCSNSECPSYGLEKSVAVGTVMGYGAPRLGRKEPNMLIGVDYHPSFQQIAFFDEETGECGERQLNHSDGEAERFYRDLQKRGIRVRVGMEATGYSR